MLNIIQYSGISDSSALLRPWACRINGSLPKLYRPSIDDSYWKTNSVCFISLHDSVPHLTSQAHFNLEYLASNTTIFQRDILSSPVPVHFNLENLAPNTTILQIDTWKEFRQIWCPMQITIKYMFLKKNLHNREYILKKERILNWLSTLLY